MNLLQTAFQKIAVFAGVDGVWRQRLHTVRKNQLLDGAVGKGIGCDSLQSVLKGEGSQLWTAVKRSSADGAQTGPERDTLQPGRGAEAGRAETDHTVGDLNCCQTVTAEEGMITDRLQCGRELYLGQCITVLERFGADLRDRRGENDARQRYATIEGTAADDGDAFRNLNFLQYGEACKLIVRDPFDPGRPVDFFQTGGKRILSLVGVDGSGGHLGNAIRNVELGQRTESEGIAADLLQPVIQRDGGKGSAVVESGDSECAHTLTERDGGEPVTAVKGRFTNFPDTVRNPQRLKTVTFREGQLCNGSEVIGKGNALQF